MLLQKKPFSREANYPTTSYRKTYRPFGTYFIVLYFYRGAGILKLRWSLQSFQSNTSKVGILMLFPSTSHSLQEKKGSYRESLPIFNFLSYLISTANIQLLYSIIAIFDVKYCYNLIFFKSK